MLTVLNGQMVSRSIFSLHFFVYVYLHVSLRQETPAVLNVKMENAEKVSLVFMCLTSVDKRIQFSLWFLLASLSPSDVAGGEKPLQSQTRVRCLIQFKSAVNADTAGPAAVRETPE